MTEKELYAKAINKALLDQKDDVLRRVLAAEPPENVKGTKKMKKKISAVVLAAALMCLLAVGAAAVWLLSAKDVAQELGYPAVAAAFDSESAIRVNQTKEENGYRVTFLGITSGADLTNHTALNPGGIDVGRSYAVTAVARADGSALTQDDGSGLVITPLIGGMDSRRYNIFSMGGSAAWDDIDGVLYFLTECDNLEIFADHPLYLAVMDGFVPTEKEYVMDASGLYTANSAYQGLNLLFRLPIDASRADPAAAAAYVQSVEG